MSGKLDASDSKKLKALRDNFPYFAKSCLKIRAKSGETKPFLLNDAQEYLHQKLEEQIKEKGWVRVLVLKGRQQGISTYVQGRYYHKTSQFRGKKAYILTHEENATKNLFSMTDRYHEHCPKAFRPIVGSSNARELLFPGLDSGYQVGTAGKKDVGRSSTIQLFHGSEVAFWPHADDHLAGVMQAVPELPGTEIILESTANGAGGVFYEMWLDAERGVGDYIAIFIPWYWQSEYVRSAEGMVFTEEEEQLRKRYGLTDEQLAWRRGKIHGLKSEDLFRQEYPMEASEAFLFSGRPVFEPKHLVAALNAVVPPLKYGDVRGGQIIYSDEKKSPLKVWEEPVSGEFYVIGADVAEGLEHGDFSSVDVLRASDGGQVAQWHGHTSPDTLGQIIVALARKYNHAYVGVERNNHGLTTLTEIQNLNYDNLYYQKDPETNKTGNRAGWLTTRKSKPAMINQLAAELRDMDHGIVCKETLDEMKTYIINDKGETEAMPKCFDDRVISRAIAGMLVRDNHQYSMSRQARSVRPASARGWT